MKILTLPLLVSFSLFYSTHSYGCCLAAIRSSTPSEQLTPEQEELMLQREARENGADALLRAARKPDRLEKLLKYGARDEEGRVLSRIILFGDTTIAYRLIREYLFKDPYGYALGAAIRKSRLDLMEELLRYGARDPNGRARISAIEVGRPDIAERMIHLKEAKDPKGYELEAAIREGNSTQINKLIEYGAQDPQGRALKAAIEKGDEVLIDRLLKLGSQDPEGVVLQEAVVQKKYALVDKLLKFRIKDTNGKSLEEAIYDGNEALVNKLLEHGAQDSQGWALGAAIYAGNDALVDKLIAHGAQDPHDYALNAAMSKGNNSLIEKIKQLKNPSSKHLKDAL